MLFLCVPFEMHEVMDVMVHSEFRGEVDLDVGVGGPGAASP